MASSAPKGASFAYFTELPPEIREQILRHVCLFPEGIDVGGVGPQISYSWEESEAGSEGESLNGDAPLGEEEGGGGGGNSSGSSRGTPSAPQHSRGSNRLALPEPAYSALPHGLLLASAQLHREASAVFYGQNAFHLNATAGRLSSLPACLADAESGLLGGSATRPTRRRVRSVVLHLRRFAGHLDRQVCPALADMILAGGLRALEVYVHEPVSNDVVRRFGGPGLRDELLARFARSPPFQALLGVLADPDLLRARFWVSRTHLRVWCPFHLPRPAPAAAAAGDGQDGHPDGERPANEVSIGYPSYRAVLVEGKQDWNEVDVQALLRVYGDDDVRLKILKIGE